ncbi:MAG: gliding motility-associated ABC transporter substrate-binding protein GldG [Bacteroidales bacterium]|nr:gliding motility-associated ABC transporter substrate-binding protein GldG [Bacteroidales bacterium]MDY5193888.1 gliding motility-associated ABC transporter substrate-binding protein GldG [Candidatus Aphodosoma sp.]
MKKIIGIIIPIVVAAIAIVLIFTRFAFFRIDLTAEKRYTLSGATKEQLKQIHEPLLLKMYLCGDLDANMLRLSKAVEEMVEEMNIKAEYPITIEKIDPNKEVDDEARYANYYKLENRGLRGMSVTKREKNGAMTEQILFPWAELCSSRDTMAISLMSASNGISGEEAVNAAVEDLEFQIIDAVRVLNRTEVKKVAFIEGHNELSEIEVYDASDALSRYFQIDRGVLGYDANVLDGYSAIIIAKPMTAYSERDKFIIDQYIMRGGRVLWLIDGARMSNDMLSEGGVSPLIKLDVNLNDILFRYGVRVTPTILEDMQCAYIPINMARPGEEARFEPIPWFFTPLLQVSPYHPITKMISPVKADFASGIELVGDTTVRKEIILATGNASHVHFAPSQVDVSAAVQVEPEEYFNNAYIPVAVSLEGSFTSAFMHRLVPDSLNTSNIIEKSINTRMIVVADGDIIRNDIEKYNSELMLVPLGYDRVTKQTHGNKNFIINSLLYLTDDEGVMNLRNRKVELRLLNRAVVNSNRNLIIAFNTIIPLVIIALFGGVFFIIRKRKYSKK